MATLSELKKAYNDKLAEISLFMKNPIVDNELFRNTVDFRDKGLRFDNARGTVVSSVDRILNIPAKGLVYKRGVKISLEDGDHEMVIESCTSSSDVDGICWDIDDFTGVAQVIPISNGFQGWLVCKKNSGIKPNDKVKFIANGEIDKETGQSKLYSMAISEPVECRKDLFIVHVIIGGYRTAP